MIAKGITYFGQQVVLACDEQCGMAWGQSGRPGIEHSTPDAFNLTPDGEMTGTAPKQPGTSEGGHCKPQCAADRLNKWCARECERSVIVRPTESFRYGAHGLEGRDD
jgi:hypothetical protein